MSKEKQIEEMAKHCTYHHDGKCFAESNHPLDCDLMCEMFGVFTNLEKAGYRKATDVAEEIFAEIEAEIDAALTSNYNFIQQHELLDALWSRVNGKIDALRGIDSFLAEIKKKYTEEEK